MLKFGFFTIGLFLLILSSTTADDFPELVDKQVKEQNEAESPPEGDVEKKKSFWKKIQGDPWLVVPIISSDPKISTAAGLMLGYVHKFDEESPASIIGAVGSYSMTDSYYYGGFASLNFLKDRHRLILGGLAGEVNNDYTDFLGTGLPVQTTDDLRIFALRYSARVYGRWYVGPQFIDTNYGIGANDALTGKFLQLIGLTGFQSSGLGIYVEYDSRDNIYSPTRGQVFEFHNVAYRETFGGDVDFDSYNLGYNYFLSIGDKNVVAFDVSGRWTVDAPTSGYSSVGLRGYTFGQYLAPHVTSAQIEERFSLTKKWGLRAFTGVALLYGGRIYDGHDERSVFPVIGGGASYSLNQEGMIIRADYAVGKDSNQGFYLSLGQSF